MAFCVTSPVLCYISCFVLHLLFCVASPVLCCISCFVLHLLFCVASPVLCYISCFVLHLLFCVTSPVLCYISCSPYLPDVSQSSLTRIYWVSPRLSNFRIPVTHNTLLRCLAVLSPKFFTSTVLRGKIQGVSRL